MINKNLKLTLAALFSGAAILSSIVAFSLNQNNTSLVVSKNDLSEVKQNFDLENDITKLPGATWVPISSIIYPIDYVGESAQVMLSLDKNNENIHLPYGVFVPPTIIITPPVYYTPNQES
ncbi:MAG: hypothetical protein LBC44_04270 [Mycoplasmataceae bacterium]|jgi:hypothetical protein|nr:hypothetical protein [Mycoplasmataceae bacterium]